MHSSSRSPTCSGTRSSASSRWGACRMLCRRRLVAHGAVGVVRRSCDEGGSQQRRRHALCVGQLRLPLDLASLPPDYNPAASPGRGGPYSKLLLLQTQFVRTMVLGFCKDSYRVLISVPCVLINLARAILVSAGRRTLPLERSGTTCRPSSL